MAMGVGARRITRSGTAGRPSDWPDPAGRYGRRRSRCVSVLRAAFPSAARRRARRMTGLSVSSRVRTECSHPPLECAMPSVSTIRKHPRPHTSAGPPPPFVPAPALARDLRAAHSQRQPPPPSPPPPPARSAAVLRAAPWGPPDVGCVWGPAAKTPSERRRLAAAAEGDATACNDWWIQGLDIYLCTYMYCGPR